MRHNRVLLLAMALSLSIPTLAGPHADSLAVCLTDNTTGKERKDLARWIFVAMSAHPNISELSNVPASVRASTNREVGVLVTRLLSENCATQAKAAIQNEGSEGMFSAFKVLGELAMKELMTNRDVATSLGAYEQFIDRRKLESALSSK